MSSKVILMQWKARKISHLAAKRDLVTSRDPGVVRACQAIDFVVEKEEETEQRLMLAVRLSRLEKTLGKFVSCKQFDEFWSQFHNTEMSVRFRFRSLLFVGKSRSGKSQRASAFHGMLRSLVVNCQGLNTALPSLLEFSKDSYDCIIFDEVTEKQVLHNKLVFQSGPKPVTLGQSPCGAFKYTRDLYAVPMILCSNEFKLTEEEGLAEEDAEWLTKNIIQAQLPTDQETWFEASTIAPCSPAASEECASVMPSACCVD